MKSQRYDEIKEVLRRHEKIADNATLMARLDADGVSLRDVELFLKEDAKRARTLRAARARR